MCMCMGETVKKCRGVLERRERAHSGIAGVG